MVSLGCLIVGPAVLAEVVLSLNIYPGSVRHLESAVGSAFPTMADELDYLSRKTFL